MQSATSRTLPRYYSRTTQAVNTVLIRRKHTDGVRTVFLISSSFSGKIRNCFSILLFFLKNNNFVFFFFQLTSRGGYIFLRGCRCVCVVVDECFMPRRRVYMYKKKKKEKEGRYIIANAPAVVVEERNRRGGEKKERKGRT